jgi:hypothetical protein
MAEKPGEDFKEIWKYWPIYAMWGCICDPLFVEMLWKKDYFSIFMLLNATFIVVTWFLVLLDMREYRKDRKFFENIYIAMLLGVVFYVGGMWIETKFHSLNVMMIVIPMVLLYFTYVPSRLIQEK